MDLMGLLLILSGLWFVLTYFIKDGGNIALIAGFFIMGIGLMLMDWRYFGRGRRRHP